MPFFRILNTVGSGPELTSTSKRTSIAYVPVSLTVNRAVDSVNVIPFPTFVTPPVEPVNASYNAADGAVFVIRV